MNFEKQPDHTGSPMGDVMHELFGYTGDHRWWYLGPWARAAFDNYSNTSIGINGTARFLLSFPGRLGWRAGPSCSVSSWIFPAERKVGFLCLPTSCHSHFSLDTCIACVTGFKKYYYNNNLNVTHRFSDAEHCYNGGRRLRARQPFVAGFNEGRRPRARQPFESNHIISSSHKFGYCSNGNLGRNEGRTIPNPLMYFSSNGGCSFSRCHSCIRNSLFFQPFFSTLGMYGSNGSRPLMPLTHWPVDRPTVTDPQGGGVGRRLRLRHQFTIAGWRS